MTDSSAAARRATGGKELAMSALARFSLANRTLVALAALVVIAFGLLAIPQLDQQLIPSIEYPTMQVLTAYQGASPDVVEEQVTDPLEDAVRALTGVEHVTSATSQGQSSITLEYTFGTDLDRAGTDLQNVVARASTGLPDGVDPQVRTGSDAAVPAAVFAVTSDLDRAALAKRLDEVAVPAIARVPGVQDTQVTGAPVQRVTVTVDQGELKDKGLTTDAVSSVLTANGVAVPAGTLTEDGRTVSVQTARTFTSAGDLEDLYVMPAVPAGGGAGGGAGGRAPVAAAPKPVRLGDVATVAVTLAPETTITRTDGKESLGLLVTATPDGNDVAISRAVRSRVPALERQLGDGTKLTVVFDQAPFVERSIRSLGTEGVLGLLFAVLVILLFLLSLRSTLVTAVSIPLSVLVALLALWAGDESLNLLTLGALTVAVGRVVDDSIVVLENVKRHLGYGEAKRQAVLDGVREVAGAVTASTLTTVAVFLPIAFVTGVVGELFQPFAIAVTVALAASLLVSLTVVPVLSYWFLKAPDPATVGDLATYREQVAAAERRSPLQRAYVPLVRFSLRHRPLTLVAAGLILLGTGLGATRLPTGFLDSSGGDTLTVTQTMPVGTALSVTDAAAQHVERVVGGATGVASYQVSVGGSAYGGPSGSAQANYSVALDRGADATAVADRIRRGVRRLDGVGTVVVGGGGGFSSDLKVVVQSGDAGDLRIASDRVRAAMASLGGVTDVSSDLSDSVPLVQVSVRRDEAAKDGLSDTTIGQAVAEAIQGSTVTRMTVGGRQVDVVLRTDDPPASLDDVRALRLTTAAGPVRLGDVATVTRTEGPPSISHVDGERSATVTGTPQGADTGALTGRLAGKLRALHLPASASYTIGGVSQDQSDSFRSLGLALLAAIAIVFLILAGTFRSIAQPLILMVSIPFAGTGALVLLLVSRTALGVSALIGLLMLIGIVVTNAIVLMDLMNRYRTDGMDVTDAVVEGGRRRLRPVLMTAVATVCALTPMALGLTGDDSSGFVSRSLALVVIGGLVSSTLLTLVIVPVLYSLLEGRKERRRARKQARAAQRRAPVPSGPVPAPAFSGPALGGPVAAAPGATVPGAVPASAVRERARGLGESLSRFLDRVTAPAPADPPAGRAPAVPPWSAAPPPDVPAGPGPVPVVPVPWRTGPVPSPRPRGDWRDDPVGSALAGANPAVLRRLSGGFAAIGCPQFLPGYAVLLTDEPGAVRLSDLDRSARLRFLADVDLLAEAVERVCARHDPAFRQVNVDLPAPGGAAGPLLAHVWPRYAWEPPEYAGRPVGRYPAERWTDPGTRLGPRHDALRASLAAELDRLDGPAVAYGAGHREPVRA